jgi:hypothetical protein
MLEEISEFLKYFCGKDLSQENRKPGGHKRIN